MPEFSSAQLTLQKSGTAEEITLEQSGVFILTHGWAPATTRQYAAAVNKFLNFLNSDPALETSQPFSAKTIYRFVFWCSASSDNPVTSSTIRRYLTGLRMWHTLHENNFPQVDTDRIRLLLKSCSKTEVKKQRRVRGGLTLGDVLYLSDRLTSDNLVDLVTKAVILVGFWGLARLGELTKHPDHPLVFVRRKDLSFSENGRTAVIRIRLAKTSQVGESQWLRLATQPNRLDPINVLQELLERIPGRSHDPLFPGTIRTIPISRSHVSGFLKANGPQDSTQWSGHSLRIGGASFQFDAGRSVVSLKKLGRWRSSVYKRYVKVYSPKLSGETRALCKLLHF